jgi:hypothetical protein
MQRPTAAISRSITATTLARSAAAPQRAMAAPVRRSMSGSSPAPLARPLQQPLPPSSAPSRAYCQHHDVEAPQVDAANFRQGWRVHSRLASLAESGRIDREQLEAAITWGIWAERVTTRGTTSWHCHGNWA